MNDIEVLHRRLEREHNARKAAELILEDKSREVFETNQALQKAACELKKEMEKSRAIVEHAAEAIITVDHHCRIQSFNPAAEKIFGVQVKNALDQPLSSMLPYFENAACPPVVGDETFGPQELTGVKSDGTQLVIELTMSNVTGIGENLVIAIIRDRTRRKQLEAQLSLAQKMESVGQLAAGIAHEINTPIQFVGDNVGFLADAFKEIESLLSDYQKLSEAVDGTRSDETELVEKINSHRDEADLEFILEEVPQAISQSKIGIDRVATIIRAMKEFSHPGVAETAMVDINQALESTITVSRNEWKYVADLETHLEDNLPPICGFPGDLNQAFLNIIVNAAHAVDQQSTDGEQTGKIKIKTSSGNGCVEIEISDSGCGIPLELQQKIFDPFFTTKDVGKGTGQGLAVVHQVIVEKHGGQIQVESKPGIGTTFLISLPLKPVGAGNEEGSD